MAEPSTGLCRSSAQIRVEVSWVAAVAPSFSLSFLTLSFFPLPSPAVATTFLTSRHTNLTTAYTVSTTDSYAPSSLHDPYVVNPPAPTSFLTPFVRAGITLFRHPELPSERDEISLFELSDRGGLSMRKLGRKVEDEAEELERMRGAPRSGREGYEWLPAVRAVADAEHKGGECGETAEIEKREVTLLDLRKQYEGKFERVRRQSSGRK